MKLFSENNNIRLLNFRLTFKVLFIIIRLHKTVIRKNYNTLFLFSLTVVNYFMSHGNVTWTSLKTTERWKSSTASSELKLTLTLLPRDTTSDTLVTLPSRRSCEIWTKPSQRLLSPSNWTKHPNCTMFATFPLYIFPISGSFESSEVILPFVSKLSL